MGTVYLLGAGASYGYAQSPTNVRPPLAAGIFDAFGRLQIAGDLGVKIGWILNYVEQKYGVAPINFARFDMDIEEFMTSLEAEVEEYAAAAASTTDADRLDVDGMNAMIRIPAFDQTLFLIATILNEISNGPISNDYVRLVTRLRDEDTIVSFNWDTLLDRALYEVSAWEPDLGYGFEPHAVFEDGWRPSQLIVAGGPTYLKLHGSTNWLSRYVSKHATTGQHSILVSSEGSSKTSVSYNVETGEDLFRPEFSLNIQQKPYVTKSPITMDDIHPLVFLAGTKKFPAFNDRYRPGYSPFTYFYAPLDGDGIPTSPLIIAPVRHKTYDLYANLLKPLWNKASTAIAEADRVVIIGFSFPATDTRVRDLFEPGRRRRLIQVVNPSPDGPVATLKSLVGEQDEVNALACTFSQYLDII